MKLELVEGRCVDERRSIIIIYGYFEEIFAFRGPLFNLVLKNRAIFVELMPLYYRSTCVIFQKMEELLAYKLYTYLRHKTTW